MRRKSFDDMNCSVAQCLEVVGEWWTMLIVRDCFLGVGSVVTDSVRLAAGVQTGAGAVVTASLEEAGLYVGMPARRLR